MVAEIELTVRDAAVRLSVSERRVVQLVQSGDLDARRVGERMWLVSMASIRRAELMQRGSGRRLAPATGWALLFELAGRQADWLPPRSRTRVLSRLKTWDARAVIAATSARSLVRRYSGTVSPELMRAVLPTGLSWREGSDRIALPNPVLLEGYARPGASPESISTEFGLREDAGGGVRLLENTMPVAVRKVPRVVALADLALRRASALAELDDAISRWRERSTS